MAVVDESRLERLGGKAATLRRLTELGFRVPAFEVSPVDLAAAVSRLGFPLVVRSSATVEDGRRLSFAGQFDSFLGLRSLAEVRDAVDRCSRGAQSLGAREYCRRHGVDPREVRMRVIVQRMIEPELAGVAFTIDPATGQERLVIEACRGLGDDLLAGRRSPLPDDDPLLRKHHSAIGDAASRIRRCFGTPQDVEFAIADDTLYVLQARPVTRIDFPDDVGEWTNADFRDGGVSSGVCTPLMWSLYDFIWERTLKQCLREIRLPGPDFQAGRMFFGRPYWNLGAVKSRVSRIPGYVERDFDDDLGVRVAYEGSGRVTRATLFGLLRSVPVVWSVGRFIRRQLATAESLVREGYGPIDRAGRVAAQDPDERFEHLVLKDYWRLESAYFRTIFALSLAKLDFKLRFRDLDYAALVGGLPPLSHAGPRRRMEEMIETSGRVDIRKLVDEFKHHCRYGIDVRHARWDEDVSFVEKLVEKVRRERERDDGEETVPLADHSRRHDSVEQCSARFGRGAAARSLARLRRLIWLREEMRDLSNRMYYHVRRAALRIADERFLGDDVFFMTWPEILRDDRGGIEAARDIFEGYRNFDAPNEIGRSYSIDPPAAAHAGAWRGIGAAAGRVTGIARVARTVEEALDVPAGAVLVCVFTEPGWTPVLGRVSAVVTETGGLLSHAAVICREYRLPAVLGVPQATRRIPDGTRVVVDGCRGTVEEA